MINVDNDQNLLHVNDIVDKTKLDIILGSQKSIDSFLLEFNEILIDKETNLPKQCNDGINEKTLLNDFISIAEIMMQIQIYKCILPYGKILPVNKLRIEENNILDVLNSIPNDPYSYDEEFIIKVKDNFDIVKEYSNNILSVLESIINNKNLYDNNFISKLEEINNIIKKYEYYRYLYNSQKRGNNFIKINEFLGKLDLLIQKNKFNDIIECFYEIQNYRKNFKNDLNKIICIQQLVNKIIINLKELLEFYKKIAYSAANILTYDINYCLKLIYGPKNDENLYQCCIKMLSSEFEKVFKSNIYVQYMYQINKLYQHAAALSDKLTIILSM
jgi:hypothetical protein